MPADPVETKVSDRKSLFLYTDQTELSDEMKAAMLEAGFVPIKVADLAQHKIISAPIRVEVTAEHMDLVTQVALSTINSYGGSVAESFGSRLAKLLLKARESANA